LPDPPAIVLLINLSKTANYHEQRTRLPQNIRSEYCFSSLLFVFGSFKGNNSQRMETLDVQQINVVENDSTVKVIVTNAGFSGYFS